MAPTNDAQWYIREEELSETPSALGGCSLEDEVTLRTKGVNFIHGVGSALRLPQLTLATAAVFYQRFFLRHSFKDFHHYEMAGSALFLATKIEETGRRLKDVILVCSQKARKDDSYIVDPTSKEYSTWQDVILFNEEALLAALCFDLSIIHPYSIALAMADKLEWTPQQKTKCWYVINDSLRTCASIIWRPETVAAASLIIASELEPTLERLPFQGSWTEVWPRPSIAKNGTRSLGVKEGDVRAAVIYLLQQYQSSPWAAHITTFLSGIDPGLILDSAKPVSVPDVPRDLSDGSGRPIDRTVVQRGREMLVNTTREKVEAEQDKSEGLSNEALETRISSMEESPSGKRRRLSGASGQAKRHKADLD